MTRDDILDELSTIFRDIFDDEAIVVTETLSAEDIEAWNSLQHINLVLAVESHFGIKFRTAELERLTSVGDLVNVIERKVA